jgi:hypothetical protein
MFDKPSLARQEICHGDGDGRKEVCDVAFVCHYAEKSSRVHVSQLHSLTYQTSMSSFGSIDSVVNTVSIFFANPFIGKVLHVLAELCDRRWPSDYRTLFRIVQRYSSSAYEATRASASVSHKSPRGQFFGAHVSNGGRIMIFAGGVPLERGRTVVGAIGVSGGSDALGAAAFLQRRGMQ